MYSSRRLQIKKLLLFQEYQRRMNIGNCEAGRQRKIIYILLLFRSKLYYKLSVYAWETLSYTEGMC